MYKETFAERLKKAREKTGFTQAEVEKETGISRVNIARYETATREPDIENIGILAEFYGVTTDWLFGLGMQGSKPNYETGDLKTIEKTLKGLGKESGQRKNVL